MNSMFERSPADWFKAAARWYVEGHQACAWCGLSHCVFRSERTGRVEYYCSMCEFSTCRDGRTGECFAASGQEPEPLPPIIVRAENLSLAGRDPARGVFQD